jgi:ORF6N domain
MWLSSSSSFVEKKVLLDADLAMLYGVEPRVLNQAVARNRKRFPADFMFQLSAREYDALTSQIVISDKDDSRGASALRSQFVISKKGRGGRRYLRYAFTEQGVAMLSSVLRSARAIESTSPSCAHSCSCVGSWTQTATSPERSKRSKTNTTSNSR